MALPLFPSSSACLSQGRQSFSEAKRAVGARVPWPSDMFSWAEQGWESTPVCPQIKKLHLGRGCPQPVLAHGTTTSLATLLAGTFHTDTEQEQREKHLLWTVAWWWCRAWCHHPGFERSPRAQDPGPNTPQNLQMSWCQGCADTGLWAGHWQGRGGMMSLCQALPRLREGLGACTTLPAVMDTNRELTSPSLQSWTPTHFAHGPGALLASQTGHGPGTGVPCCPSQPHRQDMVPCAAMAPLELSRASPLWTSSILQLAEAPSRRAPHDLTLIHSQPKSSDLWVCPMTK